MSCGLAYGEANAVGCVVIMTTITLEPKRSISVVRVEEFEHVASLELMMS
jgi:hypothetical protein